MTVECGGWWSCCEFVELERLKKWMFAQLDCFSGIGYYGISFSSESFWSTSCPLTYSFFLLQHLLWTKGNGQWGLPCCFFLPSDDDVIYIFKMFRKWVEYKWLVHFRRTQLFFRAGFCELLVPQMGHTPFAPLIPSHITRRFWPTKSIRKLGSKNQYEGLN